MNEKINVNYLSKPCYEIVLTDSFAELGESVKTLGFLCKNVCIVSDDNVFPLYGEKVASIFTALGFTVTNFIFKAGEENKTLDTVRSLYAFLIEKRISRHDLLVALGGGVVGDLCGFAAATYLRGIPFIQLPTTLLAQVDSSIGGKTGVDFDGYKNMVGAFHMPKLVYVNIMTLSSLADRQYFNGFAEVMKHGLIKDASFYEWLLENMYEICEREPKILMEMIRNSLMIKKMIVEKDPHETGIRALLNFGHTIGHALEKAMDFKLLHGECVALGAVAESYISWQKGRLKMEEYYEIRDMFVPFNLPITITDADPAKILEYTKSDKKSDGQITKFVLLKKAGKAFIDSNVTDDDILKALDEIIWKDND
ncbi:MAG: 3-dehydroquinate synthase [Lachnospiraceae bacterium]|nr:3-dehydroquinate synthase [Lachnospiraceae bacterium]